MIEQAESGLNSTEWNKLNTNTENHVFTVEAYKYDPILTAASITTTVDGSSIDISQIRARKEFTTCTDTNTGYVYRLNWLENDGDVSICVYVDNELQSYTFYGTAIYITSAVLYYHPHNQKVYLLISNTSVVSIREISYNGIWNASSAVTVYDSSIEATNAYDWVTPKVIGCAQNGSLIHVYMAPAIQDQNLGSGTAYNFGNFGYTNQTFIWTAYDPATETSGTLKLSDLYFSRKAFRFDVVGDGNAAYIVVETNLPGRIVTSTVNNTVNQTLKRSQGIILFKHTFSQANIFSDHITIDMIDEATTTKYLKYPKISLINGTFYVCVAYRHASKNRSLVYGTKVYTSKDCINWSKGCFISEHTSIADKIKLGSDVQMKLVTSGSSVVFMSSDDYFGGAMTMRYGDPVTTSEQYLDISSNVESISLSQSESRQASIVLVAPNGQYSDTFLTDPNNTVMLVIKEGFYDRELDKNIMVKTAVMEIESVSISLSTSPDETIRLSCRDLMLRITDQNQADEPTQWRSQLIAGDSFINSLTGENYGGMSHTAIQTGAWETINTSGNAFRPEIPFAAVVPENTSPLTSLYDFDFENDGDGGWTINSSWGVYTSGVGFESSVVGGDQKLSITYDMDCSVLLEFYASVYIHPDASIQEARVMSVGGTNYVAQRFEDLVVGQENVMRFSTFEAMNGVRFDLVSTDPGIGTMFEVRFISIRRTNVTSESHSGSVGTDVQTTFSNADYSRLRTYTPYSYEPGPAPSPTEKTNIAASTMESELWNGEFCVNIYCDDVNSYPGIVFRRYNSDQYMMLRMKPSTSDIIFNKIYDGTVPTISSFNNGWIAISAGAQVTVANNKIWLKVIMRYARITVMTRYHDSNVWNTVMDFIDSGIGSEADDESIATYYQLERGSVGYCVGYSNVTATFPRDGIYVEFAGAHLSATGQPQVTEDVFKRYFGYGGVHDFVFKNQSPATDILIYSSAKQESGTTEVAPEIQYPTRDNIEVFNEWTVTWAAWNTPSEYTVAFGTDTIDWAVVVGGYDSNKAPYQRSIGYMIYVDPDTRLTIDRWTGEVWQTVQRSKFLYPNLHKRVKIAYRQFLSNGDSDRWLSISVWFDDRLAESFMIAVKGDFPSDALESSSLYEYTTRIGFATRNTVGNTFKNVYIPQLSDFIEWNTIDMGEYPSSGMNRALEGRYVKMFMRYDGSVYAKRFFAKDPVKAFTIANMADYEQTFDRRGIVSHARMTGAYVEGDFIDTSVRAYRFKEFKNPMLMNLYNCTDEARKQILRELQAVNTVSFSTPHNPLWEPEDVITVLGTQYIIDSISVNYQDGSAWASLQCRRFYGDV